MKERIKSVVLVVLVILNLILGSQVLSTEKLWSGDGYNFFVNAINIPIANIFKNIKQRISGRKPSETHLEAPELIIINTGYQTSRLALDSTDEEFSSLSEIAYDFLTSAFSSSKIFSPVPTDDFYSALTAKSIYLRYPTDYDAGLFAHLLGGTRTDFSGIFSQLRNIVIAADGCVYIEDSLTGNIYSCYTDVSTESLNIIIDNHAQREHQDTPIINYAFDLGFDKAFATQKTVLSPMIPIFSDGFEVETILVERPLALADDSYNEAVVSSILPLFNMNANSFMRYTEVDGTVVFVENNATLKISPDGCLEYFAKDDGIALTTNSLTSAYDTVAAIADFVDKVNLAAESDSSMLLSSKLTASELSGDSFTITLDYQANGKLVKLSSESAVTATVTNNRLTAYRQHMRNFSPTGSFMTVDNYIFALDEAIARFENQINDIEISGLDIIYQDDLTSNILVPEWNVSVKEIIIDE